MTSSDFVFDDYQEWSKKQNTDLTNNFFQFAEQVLEKEVEVLKKQVENDNEQVENYFYKNSQGQPQGVLMEDRRQHMYVLGKTGMGKTTLLQNMLLQDIYQGHGVCYIDPHGDSCEYVLDRIPEHRHKDVIYINPADIDYPVAINILEPQRDEPAYLIASSLMAVFNKIWIGTWSSRMEYILNNTLLSLLERKGNTLLGVLRMLTDEDYRLKTIKRLKDPVVKAFWLNEFENFHDRYRQEAISPILNKIGQFFSSEVIRNILGQSKSTIDFRKAMDEGKIILVNLSKGKLGEDNSNLLGSLLVAKLQTSALSRVDIAENQRQDFYLYVDEFQNFTTDSFAGILSEARKFKLNLFLAHQYVSQLEESGTTKVKNAVFGNVGTIVCFRLGAGDAKIMSEEMAPEIVSSDFLTLNRGCMAIRLSRKGQILPSFLAKSLPPLFDNMGGNFHKLVILSRQKYARHRQEVADNTKEWLQKVYQEAQDVLVKNGSENSGEQVELFEDESFESIKMVGQSLELVELADFRQKQKKDNFKNSEIKDLQKQIVPVDRVIKNRLGVLVLNQKMRNDRLGAGLTELQIKNQKDGLKNSLTDHRFEVGDFKLSLAQEQQNQNDGLGLNLIKKSKKEVKKKPNKKNKNKR